MYTVIENPKGLTEYSSFSRGFVLEDFVLESHDNSKATICFYDYSTQKNDIFGGISNLKESGFVRNIEGMFESIL